MENQLKSEKVTITIPSDLKEKIMVLKDELNVSISYLYRDALEVYLENREFKRWERAAKMALEDKAYMKFVKELGEDTGGDVYEY